MGTPNITLLPVESSQIHSIGHDPENNILAIRFKDRFTGGPSSLYHYRNFTTEDFKAFREAESIGSHFYKYIKPELLRYPYTKIESAPAKAA
jgi:hypothetical protein